ncbi:MAG: hypothetical protein HKN47_25530, partial [Pirellulaceae bacterium]|nr:hypothetical protein [Pirellulaceae bacterium]
VTPVLQSGDANTNGRLDVGETWTYTATATVTTGQYTNIGSVSANPVDANGADIPGLADVNANDPSNHFGVTAEINIEKSTNGQDADAATGPQVAAGSTVNFTYVVTNTGNTQLATVTVTDDRGVTPVFQSGDTDVDGRLDPNETWTYTGNTIATAGQYTNIGTVTANPVDTNGGDIPSLNDVSDTDPSNHLGVASTITIEKATNGQDSDTGPGQSLDVGSTATFTYVVTNTGLVISNVAVRDDNGTPGNSADDITPNFTGGDTNSNGLLDVGESWQYTATRIVTSGQYTNIATVTGNTPSGGNISDTDASNHVGVDPCNELSKRCFLASSEV